MFCPNCGTQNSESATTCTKCGFNLKGAAAPKFKGTMLMMNPPRPGGGTPGQGVPLPPPATAGLSGPAPRPGGMKGTIVGVAPPSAGSAAPPTASTPPPPQAPGGGGTVAFVAPGQGPSVNPMGSTLVANEGVAPPPNPPQPQGGLGTYGPPPGFGAEPPGGGGGGFGAPGGGGFGSAPPGGGGAFGGPPAGPGNYGGPPGGLGTPPPFAAPGGGPGGYAPPPAGNDPFGGGYAPPPELAPQGGGGGGGFGGGGGGFGSPPGGGGGGFGGPPGGGGFGGPPGGFGAPGGGYGAPGGQPGYASPPAEASGSSGFSSLGSPGGGAAMVPMGNAQLGGPPMGGGAMQGAGGAPIRNPVLALVSCFLCCPWYGLYQCMKAEEDVNRFLGRGQGGSILWLLFPIIPVLSMPKLMAEARARAGTPTQGEGNLLLYWLAAPYFFLTDVNELWGARPPG